MTARLAYLAAYGCQMNVLDAERVEDLLRSEGWHVTTDPASADLYLINTCSVREHAEDKVSSTVGQLSRWKTARAGRRLGILGCMAQREQEALFRRLPQVDFLCGPENYPALPEMLRRLEDPGVTHLSALEQHGEVIELAAARSHRAIQAFVNVSQGCDRTCSFCIVPTTRGGEKSRDPEVILGEVRSLVSAGVREVTLLGQTVNSYRWGAPRTDLADLLTRVAGVEGLWRVRVITNHPAYMTSRLIDALAAGGPICPSLPLPLQSGSDRVLAAMRRGYTVDRYRRILQEARERIPALEVTSDFIVGFPTETAAECEETLAAVREFGFENIFAFKYSPRPGTEAFGIPDDVPREEKERRHRALVQAQAEVSRARHAGCVGTVLEVLAEGPSKRHPERLTGRDRSGRLVHFPGGADRAGGLVPVRVDRATALSLVGEAV